MVSAPSCTMPDCHAPTARRGISCTATTTKNPSVLCQEEILPTNGKNEVARQTCGSVQAKAVQCHVDVQGTQSRRSPGDGSMTSKQRGPARRLPAPSRADRTCPEI
jgi:hypothetical protein